MHGYCIQADNARLSLAFSKHPMINHDALVYNLGSIHCASVANACQASKLLSILYTNMRERRQLKLDGFAGSSGCSGKSVSL